MSELLRLTVMATLMDGVCADMDDYQFKLLDCLDNYKHSMHSISLLSVETIASKVSLKCIDQSTLCLINMYGRSQKASMCTFYYKIIKAWQFDCDLVMYVTSKLNWTI